MAHVVVETRRVYRSARGCKLTKHAAYIAAAKHLIAKACDCHRGDSQPCIEGQYCDCDSETCRFHERDIRLVSNFPDHEPIEVDNGPVYYLRVLPRLVRFLKFVDSRETKP